MQNTAPVNPSGGTGGSKLILLQIYPMVVTSAGTVGHRDHFEDEINLTTVFFCCLMDKLYLWGKFQASPFPLAVSRGHMRSTCPTGGSGLADQMTIKVSARFLHKATLFPCFWLVLCTILFLIRLTLTGT